VDNSSQSCTCADKCLACSLREARFPHLTSAGVGFGDARCIVFAHESAKLGSEHGDLSRDQAALAEALYRDMRSAGDTMSLDEVKTRLLAGEVTGAQPRIGFMASKVPSIQGCAAFLQQWNTATW
jgi:hypothetical protein